jgi:hypothetical protein
MPNILSRIFGPANLASGTSTPFTGTTGHTYTLRNIRVVNGSAAAILFKLGIGGVLDANLIIPQISIPAGGILNHDCFIVMAGTETLQANTGGTGLTLTVSGLDQS